MNIDASNIAALDFAKGDGLIAAIVQHAVSRAVLMLGYMNTEALPAARAASSGRKARRAAIRSIWFPSASTATATRC